MKRVIHVDNEEQLELCHREKFEEIILSPLSLSRFGSQSLEECCRLAERAKKKGLSPLLEWDILMNESCLSRLKQTDLASLPWELFDAVRVQDKGALNHLLEASPCPPLHLILETGNHNLEGIKKILATCGEKVRRVVLSLELPKEKVLRAAGELPVPVEILGLGKILLYHGPRHLLGTSRRARAHSLEGPHRNLSVLDNRHGTFLFHSRDRFILHLVPELTQGGLGALRIDLRFGDTLSLLPLVAKSTTGRPSPEIIEKLRQYWPGTLTQGFFRSNKTDLLFKKLKNPALPSRDHLYIGEVLEFAKGHHVAVLVKSSQNTLTPGESVTFHTPEGRTRHMTIESLRDTSGRERKKIGLGEIGLLPPLPGLSVKSFVYRLSQESMVIK